MRRIIIGVVAVAALVAAAALMWTPQKSTPVTTASVAAITPPASQALPLAPDQDPRLNIAPRAATAPSPILVPSWEGTEVDGDIHFDEQGRLIPDQALKRFYDYLLTALSQIDLNLIHQHLAMLIEQRHLPLERSTQVVQLFDHYVAYLKAADDLHDVVGKAQPGDLHRLYEQRHQLRIDQLGREVAEGFFGESEAEDRATLARMDIVNDKSLSPEERKARLAALDQSLGVTAPENSPTATLATLQSGTEALRKSGATEAEIQAFRERTVGAAAAERLQQLDRDNAAWDQRVATLRSERAQILATPGIADADKQQQIDALIAREFSGPEATRARALIGIPPSS